MKNMKKYVILAALIAVVCGLIVAKSLQTYQTAEGLADDSVIGKGKPVLLELGSHGCIPCNKMMPILAELNTEQTTFAVSFIDVKQDQEKGKHYEIELIPTQIFFSSDGEELFRHVGFYAKEDILNKWNELGVAIQ